MISQITNQTYKYWFLLKGISGNMFTYNYNDASGLMLSNTDYTICVRTERNFCGIQYSTCVDTLNNPTMSFSITG